MNFDQALAYLYGLGHETVTIKLGLSNTEKLLNALGRPQDAFRKVQVAGTNGKGSTCAFLESILRAAGLIVGLNTSPHLVEVTERIRLNGADISREDFARVTGQVYQAAETLRADGVRPTFFEHLTAMALAAFRAANCEIGILETGLGGRLDATTVAGAETVAITPIHYDHTKFLGDTFASIAAEKAAVIRPGARAVVAPQPVDAMQVILARCAECGVAPVLVEENAEVTGHTLHGRLRVNIATPQDRYEDVTLALRGRHQIVNALTAVNLAETLREQGLRISREAIREGLATARHNGRLEYHEGPPPMLYDGAHNEQGAQALHDYLQEFVKQPITLVFGSMRDKKMDKIAPLLFPHAARVILTQPDQPRSATPESLAKSVPESLRDRVLLAPSVRKAIETAQEITPPDGLILVTGSLYLVGEALGTAA
jgi:dihydrofolate synthase/folylpolyglutamate synthase